jgi:hypothetical protein
MKKHALCRVQASFGKRLHLTSASVHATVVGLHITALQVASNGTNYNAGSQAVLDELNSGRADFSLYPTPVTSST